MPQFIKIAAGLAVAFIVAGGGAYYAISNAEPQAEQPAPEAIEPAAVDAQQVMPQSPDPAQEGTTAVPSLSAEDVEAALAERSLGSADAPVTVKEFASLTCSHCGTFHRETFDRVKGAYIDTGKVRFIFSDFPLNGPALDATMVARCLPEEQYVDFITLLFTGQDQWAYSPNYKTFLKQNAQMAGLTPEKFEACLASEELRKGLLEKMQAAGQEHEISSTPSFVVNDGKAVTGARDFEAFSKILDEALEQ